MIQKVLVCSDGSEHALKAVETAGELAQLTGASVTLLHVFQFTPPPSLLPAESGFASVNASPPPDDVQELVARRSAEPLLTARVEFKDRRELAESVEEAILSVAEEERSDLIVLGSRGLGAVRRFLLGSVSDRVAHHARCAVLIVK